MLTMESISALAALTALFALRDGLLLAIHRPTSLRLRAAAFAVPVGLLLLAGELADRFAMDEFLRLLTLTPVWGAVMACHLGWAIWLVRQRHADMLAPLSLWSGPMFLVAAVAACFSLLKLPLFSRGLWAGAAAAMAYGAVVAAGRLVWRPRLLRQWGARELLIATHLSCVVLLPINAPEGNSMNSIHDLLYVLSNAFLLPTLVGTLAAFAYATWVVGRFIAETVDQRHNAAALRQLMVQEPTRLRFLALDLRGDWKHLKQEIHHHPDFPAMADKAVADIEHRMTARVERLGIMSKVGPMLGLIGTLIPLQPALAGLAKGDVQAMGANLQIGFTTTVLGLLAGGTCYAVGVVMRGWYQQDVTDMHFLLALWAPTDSVPEPEETLVAPLLNSHRHSHFEEPRLESR
jgi:biopolymer transport protein ExbB/TolQ